MARRRSSTLDDFCFRGSSPPKKEKNVMKKVATIRTSTDRRNTRPPSRETEETVAVLRIEPQNFEDADFQGRREIARECFTREDLHYHASHAINSADARIVRDLKAVIG